MTRPVSSAAASGRARPRHLFASVSLVGALALLAPQAVVAASPTGSLAAVEAWVSATSPTDRQISGASPTELLRLFVRCATLKDESSYCLHLGWSSPGSDPETSLTSVLDAAASRTSGGGAASLVLEIQAFASLPRSERLEAELSEAREAFAGAGAASADAARVMQLEQWLSTQTTSGDVSIESVTPCEPPDDCDGAPLSLAILDWDLHGAEQKYTNYCGPASARMAGRWKGVVETQDWWWQYTEYNGQGYSTLPKIKNALNDYAYTAAADKFSIIYFSAGQTSTYLATIIDRIWTDDDPAISSVWLSRSYFPYFSQDWNSGHFQVVRGYYLYSGGYWDPHFRLFEPFNENRFWSSKPVTSGPRSVTDNQLFNATMANGSRVAA